MLIVGIYGSICWKIYINLQILLVIINNQLVGLNV